MNNLLQKIKTADRRITGSLFLLLAAIAMIYTGHNLLKMHEPDTLYPGEGVTDQRRLSDYSEGLAGSHADTDIYFLESGKPGAKVLVLGGTHNDEPSGQLSAITLIENAVVSAGSLYVIPRMNNSGATYVQEMTGQPKYVELETAKGLRKIRTGSRYANTAHQFPDPDVFKNTGHAEYPGPESRNINRVYPGREDGYLVEQAACGLIEFVNKEKIDLVIDLHEAVPEHYVVNCIIGHDSAMELVAYTTMGLQMWGVDIKMYPSPEVPGFSHRSIGDNSSAMSVLAETTNILQGAFRGKPTQELLHTGKDPFYDILVKKEKVFVDYSSAVGVSLSERVGRHLTTVMELTRNLPFIDPEKEIIIENVPELQEMLENGIESYLEPKSNV